MAYISVAQRKQAITTPNVGGYIPVAERQKMITPAISAPVDLGLPSFEMKTTTPAVLSPDFQTPQKLVGTFAKAVGQYTAQNIMSATMSFSKPFAEGIAEPIQASDLEGSPFVQSLFENLVGKEAVLKPVETRIAEAELKIKDWQAGLQEVLKTPNLNTREKLVLETLTNLKPINIAFLGIMGDVGLDITGFGGLEKNVFKQIVKVKTIGDGLIIGRKLRIADDLLEHFAQQAVKVANDADAEKLFKSTANLQQTTKAKPAYIPVKDRITPTTAPETTIAPKVEVRDKTGLKLQDPHTAEYLPTNPDGTITLYHSTTKEGAEKIRQAGIFGSKTEGGDIYFTTNKKGYGGIGKEKDTVLAFNVDPKTVRFDDVYRGELHLKGNNADMGGLKPIDTTIKFPNGIPKELEPLAQEARKYKSAEDVAKQATIRGEPERALAEVSKIAKTYEQKPVSLSKLEFDISGRQFEKPEISLKAIQDNLIKLARGEELKPVIVNQKGVIIDGQHRAIAYKIAGKENIPAYVADGVDVSKFDNLATRLAKHGDNLENYQGVFSKSQLEAIWEGANKVRGAELPVLPKLPSTPDMASKTLPLQKQGQLAKRIEKSIEPSLSPMVTQRARESTLLKKKLEAEAVASRRGAKAGEKIGEARAENIAEISKEKAVRKEQLKALKGGIEIRAKKDAIINVLKTTTESTERIKGMITQHVKDALDPADRGKALTLIRDAKTHKDLTKAFARINRWAEDSIKKDLKNEILKTQKSIMDSPSIAIDYKSRVKELMGDFELKGHREATLERLKKTQEFLQSEIAKGNDVEIPRRILKSLELLNRTPFDEITINQLTGLKAEMELLEDLGRTKFKTSEAVWEIQKTKILDEITLQGSKPIQNIELIKPEIGERLTFTQKFKNLIWSVGNQAARIDKAISPMDTIFDLLDGGKATYAGANFRYFKGQVDAGYGRYLTRKDALQKPIFDLEAKYKFADTNYERMGVVAAREQDNGMQKLIASGFTEEQVNAVKLTSQEQEMLDLMRSIFDSQFPEIQDTMRRVYNQPVEKVKNYFSFMTDWKAMDETEVFQRFGSQLPEQFGAPRKNVEAGFTKSRVGGDQKIKINAMDVFTQHTDNTSYLLELGETSKMLGEVAVSPEYAELVGDVGQLMVREWLDVIARKGGAAGASEIAILNTLRKNVGIGILGLKLSTIAIQPTALIDGMGFIGVKYGTKGVTNFATSKEWRKFVLEMPEISDRMGGEFALRELTDENWLQNIQKKGFIPTQTLDQITAGSVAAGAYERKMIELGLEIDLTKGFNKEALEYAQLAVRRTQSSGAFKDVPLAISRGALTGNRSLDRAMLQFQNFLLTRWSRIRHDGIRAGINTKDPKKAIPIFIAIIMAGLAGAGIRLGVNKVQDFITGREDKDTVAEDLQKSFMYEMTGNVPFLGTAVSMALYDGEMFPILDAPKGIISGLNRVITSKSEGAKLRGFTEFAGSTGAILGIPGSAQAEQLVRGALQEEKKSPAKTGLPGLPKLPKLPSLPKLPKI